MIANDCLQIETSEDAADAQTLWRLNARGSQRWHAFAPPVFEVEGRAVEARLAALGPAARPPRVVHGGVTEHVLAGTLVDDPGLTLEIAWRIAQNSPIVRFRYTLRSTDGRAPRRLTKTTGADALLYLGISLADLPDVTEVRFAEFNEMVHSFCLSERAVGRKDFTNGLSLIGPMLVGAAPRGDQALLVAYEHGSQVPDAFLAFDLAPDRAVRLRAVKGNYCDGQIVGGEQEESRAFTTPWFQAGVVAGDADALAAAYREFVLAHQSPNRESRRPYIFYNTWNFQERNRWWYGQQYLDSMNEARILQEIEVAHRMGIEVFVLDTGWYEKTGDWQVSRARFPRGLAPIKAKLDACGMKMGLWFNPTVAALSSRMRREHEDCLMTRGGKPHDPHGIWETESSQGLCLVSRYGEAFADELIRLAREVGVTYFKWDAIGQYGCDAAGHGHGNEENTPDERRDRYAFLLGGAMARVVDKLCAACPDAIVDFDITEGGRTVGLQFLSAGKYFLINNGPYSSNYDMPVPADGNVNLFFWPGPARAWVCRTPLPYDTWVPSVLFLTHYLPDDRYLVHGWSGSREVVDDANQWISIASLVLGQNGIWGDLLRITDEGIARFGRALTAYKQVREEVTRAALVLTGAVGGSPEVYEKIDPATGRGVVSVFASAAGRYSYVTHSPTAPGAWHNDGVSVARDGSGRARLDVAFEKAGAKVVFFGVSTDSAPPA
jgi:alpha-galactosidase